MKYIMMLVVAIVVGVVTGLMGMEPWTAAVITLVINAGIMGSY